MASDQQEAWLIMPGKAGSNVMTGVNSLPNDETDAAELRKAQSFGSSATSGFTLDFCLVFYYNYHRMKTWLVFWYGIFKNNPTFRLVLGLCPTLAVTTSLENALGMGLAAAFVLV